MKFSTFHIMSQPESASSHQIIEETLAEIDAAERLNFANTWLTEHHGSRYGLGVAPAVLAAAVASRTQRLGIGFAVHVSALHHPLRLAEEIAMVDHLSQGRVIAGFGSGYSPREYQLYGVDFTERRERQQEILDIIRRAWQEDGFDHTGRFYQFNQVSLALKPYQQPHPPIALTAANPEAFKAAGSYWYWALMSRFVPPWMDITKGHWLRVRPHGLKKPGKQWEPYAIFLWVRAMPYWGCLKSLPAGICAK
jgi:alkanesulfonate monooxygenase SsuD/methylene tetrahydromethanopterin reductase-like flavin-dependent oxidoreductase (luciferase family)